ncbi:MAG: four helix bundle protein [Eubacteriales bacterium]
MNSEEVGCERCGFMGSPLQEKSKTLALQIIKVCNEVKKKKRESVLTNQLIRSGTSIGANIREAFYAHGKADFIAKLQIALKECSESEYWLELLIESGYYNDRTILEQCIEIKKILIASINTAKNNTK